MGQGVANLFIPTYKLPCILYKILSRKNTVMAKHWYRNNELNNNKLLSDENDIPKGYSKEAYSEYQSKLQSGENHPNFGKKRPLETRIKISKSNKGKKHSEETKRHLSEMAKKRDWSNFHPNHKGKNNPRYGTRFTMDENTKSHFLNARYETMKKNGTFTKSKPEEDYYKYLVEKYGKNDVFRQYKSEKYPFACDFYIKSIDKYIECNYNWTHGFHPFNKNNPEDIAILKKWESKTNGNDYYANAIYVWTDLDVRKHKIAKENNLNIEFLYNY